MNEELQEMNASIPTLTFGDTFQAAKPQETQAETAENEAAPLNINLDDSVLFYFASSGIVPGPWQASGSGSKQKPRYVWGQIQVFCIESVLFL